MNDGACATPPRRATVPGTQGNGAMEVLVYLVPLALSLGLLGLGAFLWSLKTGQYDDLDGAAWRAIMDDDQLPPSAGQKRQDVRLSEEAPRRP